MITPEQNARLKQPFEFHDHEFTRGFVYISEEAIAERLDEIDPSWEFRIIEIGNRKEQIYVRAELTICGVTRANTGEQVIQYLKDKDQQPTDIESGEPEKGATTDAFKRCARMHGIGRYLLKAPKEAQFQNWLRTLTGNTQNAANRPNNTKSGQATQPTPPPSDAPIETELTHIEVKEGSNGMYLTFITKENTKFAVWSRKLFIDAGWITKDDWKEATKGFRQLTEPIPVRIQYDGQYWQLSEVGQMVF